MDISAIEKFAGRFDPDPQHSRQVAETSLAMFDALEGLHGLDARARGLLHAAALLHDVGYSQDAPSHHKRSRDMILGSGLPGFSTQELAVVACVARYHRKSLPDPSHRVYGDLEAESQGLVCRLAAILRIADGLDRSHMSSARSVRVACEAGKVRIAVEQDPPAPADIQAARKKADLFGRVFGLEVHIAAI